MLGHRHVMHVNRIFCRRSDLHVFQDGFSQNYSSPALVNSFCPSEIIARGISDFYSRRTRSTDTTFREKCLHLEACVIVSQPVYFTPHLHPLSKAGLRL